ncbi:MAG: M55 family metallopeptidase [Gemmatimonadota bacterium]
MHPAARHLLTLVVLLGLLAPSMSAQTAPPRIFVSVDMEGIGGIGTSAMTSSSGKDYATGRRLVTDEVNTVTDAIFARYPDAEVLVNDSHGDHQNVLHLELDPRVSYIQGSIKPLGMVQGLDDSFDGAVFIGYHAMAGDLDGFLAHTGSGSVKGLWLNEVEVGEGGMNAVFAGSLGVPVVLVAGDAAATRELGGLLDAEMVTTKTAETPASARLIHPERVHELLADGVARALDGMASGAYTPLDLGTPVRVRMRFASTTHVDILQSIPGMSKVDGFTVAYTARDADEAYRLIRLMYRFVTS